MGTLENEKMISRRQLSYQEIVELRYLFEGLQTFADHSTPDILRSFGNAFACFVKHRPDFGEEAVRHYSEVVGLIETVSRYRNIITDELIQYEELDDSNWKASISPNNNQEEAGQPIKGPI